MMKKLYFLRLLCLTALCASAAACDATIHEYPDVNTAEVTLLMSVDTRTPQLYRIVDYTSGSAVVYTPEEWDLLSRSFLEGGAFSRSVDPAQWDLHLVWELYDGNRTAVEQGNARLIERRSRILPAADPVPAYSTVVEIPAGDYTLLAWADYVPSGMNADYFYGTSDLTRVSTDIDRRKTCPDNDLRDSFSKMVQFSLPPVRNVGEQRSYSTTLTRPQGCYAVLAADYDTYLELTDYPVTGYAVAVTYPSYVNVGYSVVEERPNESETGLTYAFAPRLYTFDGRQTVLLAYDYSLVGGGGSHVQPEIDMEYASGAPFLSLTGIDIPLRADRLTIVLGNFLTGGGNYGGIVIDDGFDDETVIEY